MHYGLNNISLVSDHPLELIRGGGLPCKVGWSLALASKSGSCFSFYLNHEILFGVQ